MITRGRRTAALLAGLAALVAISACQSAAARAYTTPATLDPGVTVEADIEYRDVDGQKLALNSCVPATATAPTPGVLLLHGGGFIEGSRDSGGMADMCRAMAKAGLAAFSIDYRLVPDFHFPAQTDDAAAAIAWLRSPEQVTRFNIDPARLGALGSSAGAIIAQYLGVAGEGPLDAGTRVKAVASYSGVSDLSQKGLTYGKPSAAAIKTILDYLGCTTTKASECPDAIPASPIAQVNAGDPAMILLNSDAEIVPVGQTTAMQAALDTAGVANKVIIESGSKHGMQLNTPDNQAAVIEFLMANL